MEGAGLAAALQTPPRACPNAAGTPENGSRRPGSGRVQGQGCGMVLNPAKSLKNRWIEKCLSWPRCSKHRPGMRDGLAVPPLFDNNYLFICLFVYLFICLLWYD